MRVRSAIVLGLLLGTMSAPLAAQRVHQVKLVRGATDQFRFDPSRVNARAGDVLEFVVQSGGPYVVGFEAADLHEADQALLDQAIPDRSGPLRGPVLSGTGSRFRIVIPGLPRGKYRFTCVTHVAYRMGGVLVIQ